MAWRKFESNQLRTAIKHALEFERANSANQTDDDEGYENALSFAAQVAEGGVFNTYENKIAGLMFEKFQRLAEVEIWHRLRSGLLAAYGSPTRRGAPPEWISPFAWQGLRRITENSNDVSGDGNLYYNVYVVGLTPLPHGQSSAPETPLSASGVKNHHIYQTGAPGRPTSIHLVKNELNRRATEGQVNTTSKRQEARSLSEWLKQAHPGAPAMTPKTIENQIGEMWRELISR